MLLQPNSATADTAVDAPVDRWRALRNSAYILLEVVGWLSIHTLAILGCVVVAFLFLSGPDFSNFFMQVDNLTSRYLNADYGRRAVFEHQVIQIFMIVYFGSLVLRAPRFVKRLRAELRSPVEGAMQ